MYYAIVAQSCLVVKFLLQIYQLPPKILKHVRHLNTNILPYPKLIFPAIITI